MKKLLFLLVLLPKLASAHLCNSSLSSTPIPGSLGLQAITRDQCFTDTVINNNFIAFQDFVTGANILAGDGTGTAGNFAIWSSDNTLTTEESVGFNEDPLMLGIPYTAPRIAVSDTNSFYPYTIFGEMVYLGGVGIPYQGRIAVKHLDNENFPMFSYWGYAPSLQDYVTYSSPRVGIWPTNGYHGAQFVSAGSYGGDASLFALTGIVPNVPDPNRFNAAEVLTLVAESCSSATRNVCTSFNRNLGLQCSSSTDGHQWNGSSGGCADTGVGGTCTLKNNQSCGTGTWAGGAGTGGLRLNRTYLLTYAFEDFDTGQLRNPRIYDVGTDVDCPSCMGGAHTRDGRQVGVAIPSTDANGRGYKIKATLPKMCFHGDSDTHGVCASDGSTSCSSDADCGGGAGVGPNFCTTVRKACSVDSDCGTTGSGSIEHCSEWPGYCSNSVSTGTDCNEDSDCGGGGAVCLQGADRVILYTVNGPQTNGTTSANTLRTRQNFINYPDTFDYVYGAPNDVSTGLYEGEQPIEQINTSVTRTMDCFQDQGPVCAFRQISNGNSPEAFVFYRGSTGYLVYGKLDFFPDSTGGVLTLSRISGSTADIVQYKNDPAVADAIGGGVNTSYQYYRMSTAGDTQPSYRVVNSGFEAGPGGSTAPDATLTRTAATTWTSNSNIIVADTKVVTLGATAFASLPASTNGTLLYCNNCTKATPCASGGNGAIAKRLNGAWDCD